MAGRRPLRPRGVSSLAIAAVDDEATNRALDQVGTAIQKLQTDRNRAVVVTDLLVGTNKVRHGLGRPVAGYTVTPTYLTIAFGHAINQTNPRPDLEVWIDVVGSDQLKTSVEIW